MLRLLPLLPITVCGLPGPADAQLTLHPPVLRLGEVQGGPTLRQTVLLRNDGPGPVQVLGLERGCSCIQATLDSSLIAPAAQTKLALTLRTLGHKDGPYAWNTRIRYRSGDDEKEALLRVEATIRNDVAVTPSELVLHVADAATAEIVLQDHRSTPLKVTHFATALPGTTLTWREEAAGAVRLIFHVERAKLSGKQEGVLDILTSDPFYGHLTVPVRIECVDLGPIQATPERIRLDLEGGIRTALVRLRGKEDEALKITRVEAPAGVQCTWAENPGGGAMLRVRVEGAAAHGTALRVRFAEKGELTIPIEWR